MKYGNIVRIQTPNGMGVYRNPNFDIFEKYKSKLFDAENHPVPSDDKKLVAADTEEEAFKTTSLGNRILNNENMLCGFVNKEQARRWFIHDEMLRCLDENGYKVFTMFGYVLYGDTQALIDQRTMQEEAVYDIPHFFDLNAERNFDIGDVVQSIGVNRLISGFSNYNCAVVASLNPFILISEGGDMKWESMVESYQFEKIGEASHQVMKNVMNRLVREFDNARNSK